MPKTRKRDTGEAGNRGQFGRSQRDEAAIDLSSISDDDLADAIEDMELEEDLEIDVDGDGVADGELDILREGDLIVLAGTITLGGQTREVREEVGDASSFEQLRSELLAAAQRVAQA
ncbi:hypothetical protein [Brachybacterium kimchii]|uniref:Uncharacterized protein n=1 Tax=Brachybacterium kimchii TaxID=2942909 RepID=A0ABY4N8Q0_9MICO|nr:hypothetical protein [Brachybacterium kimchii]UQN30489.1 hypothetical protein M4486_03865 [Brachybacterium kimchii]